MTELDSALSSDYNDQLQRGSLEDRYRIYVHLLQGTGVTPKTFDEWLSS